MKTFVVANMALPCQDCFITNFVAGLEYPNGSYANADTGLWLHHVLIANLYGKDASCPDGGEFERSFAAGNERSRADLTLNG